MENKNEAAEQKDQVNEINHLKRLFDHFTKIRDYTVPRAARMKSLLERKHVAYERKDKLSRRLYAAQQEAQHAINSLDSIKARLDTLAQQKQ